MNSSIQSLQTRLFIKRCLLEEYLIKTKEQSQQKWTDSFIYDQTIGYSIGRLYRLLKFNSR